jgi:hypothetical protein
VENLNSVSTKPAAAHHAQGHDRFPAHRNDEGVQMSQKSSPAGLSSERMVKDIRRAIRRQYSADEPIRILLDGLRGGASIAELCRREGLTSSLYPYYSGKPDQDCFLDDVQRLAFHEG